MVGDVVLHEQQLIRAIRVPNHQRLEDNHPQPAEHGNGKVASRIASGIFGEL